MRLKDKVALITGRGTGIGKATALLFAKKGASIVITGRRKTPLEETISQIRNLRENAVFVAGNATKTDDAKNMVRKTTETFGRLDILINNAGVNYKPNSTSATNEDAGWCHQYDKEYGLRISSPKDSCELYLSGYCGY